MVGFDQFAGDKIRSQGPAPRTGLPAIELEIKTKIIFLCCVFGEDKTETRRQES